MEVLFNEKNAKILSFAHLFPHYVFPPCVQLYHYPPALTAVGQTCANGTLSGMEGDAALKP
jgi:hypothetical protein